MDMGSMETPKEQIRSAGWESVADALWQDIRYSLRMMAKSPGFTAVAVLSLALGIGANTAIFTLINGLLLKSLPVGDPSRLVSFGEQNGGGAVDGIGPGPLDLFPYEFYRQLQPPQYLLRGLCAYASFQTRISIKLGDAQRESATEGRAHLVSGNFFQVLQARALLGRTLIPDDAASPGQRSVAVASYAFWRDSLSSDPGAIGRTLHISGTTFTIVGVMPPNFYGVDLNERLPDFWVPLTMQTETMLQPSLIGPHGLYWLHMMGRRQPGVSLGQVQSWITAQTQRYMVQREAAQLDAARKQEIRKIFVPALPGDRGVSELRAQYSQPLELLMGVVVVVLLIACANLANFLLARASSREREISTRLALGSGSGRIARQMLTETLLLSLCGGALGLLFAYWGTRGLINFVAKGVAHTPLAAAPDLHVLLFTLGISLFTGLLFGLGPALRIPRLSLTPGLQATVRSAASAGGRTGRLVPKFLVAFQVTLSLMLLAGAGLFVRTLHNLQNQNVGFDRSNVLLVTFNAKFAGYKAEQVDALYSRILAKLKALPGVRAAAISGGLPISGGTWDSPIFIKGRTSRPNEDLGTLLNRVSPGYFETLNIPRLRGRTIDPHDTAASQKVVVVNRSLANYFFPHGDAIGHTFTVADPSVTGEWQIVGVVADSKYNSPRERPQRMAYLCLPQLTGDDAFGYFLQVRTVRNPARVTAEVRRAFAQIDPNLPISEVATTSELVDDRIANEILVSRLSSFFSILALSLACIGLYGVMTYNVLRRASEIGIRMTLGAQAAGVRWMILKESLLLLGIGVAFGLPATVAVTHLVQSQLFGLSSADPLTLTGATCLLASVVLLAAYFPARRATRVDPMVTLRYQ
jgi:predicted permease